MFIARVNNECICKSNDYCVGIDHAGVLLLFRDVINDNVEIDRIIRGIL